MTVDSWMLAEKLVVEERHSIELDHCLQNSCRSGKPCTYTQPTFITHEQDVEEGSSYAIDYARTLYD